MSMSPNFHLKKKEKNWTTGVLEMQNYLRRWHTTQPTASQVLQPCANNDSRQIHYTFSLVYVFSLSRLGYQK